MKNIRFIPFLCMLIVVFGSCTTDVDLYADYKDVPIIYAMLNPRADTNYIKITRAFCGTNDNPINANEVALISDSSNYSGKLDASIIELKSTFGGAYESTGRVFELDTMTIHNKDEGTFYSPNQIVYYTTERFNAGTEEETYQYRLVVVKPDGDTLIAQTKIVGKEEFVLVTNAVHFEMEPTQNKSAISFRADGVALIYEIGFRFNYREQLVGQEMKRKSVSRSFGIRTLDDYEKIEGTTNSYSLKYSVNWLFNTLANAIGNDTVVNPNHPNVVRYIDDFVISISAAGDELYYYYLANEAQQESPVELINTYTNINGGYGLFSSRVKISKVVRLSANTKRELLGKSSWGFQEQ